MLRNSRSQWGSVAKAMHWLVAFAIVGNLTLGWYVVNLGISPTKIRLFVWHKSIGLTVLAVVILRILWRITNPAPALPDAMRPMERILAHATHALLYVVMLAIPISGWVINSAANFPLKLYGLFLVPNIAPPDKALQTTAEIVHLSLFWILAALLILHVAAALRHHFVQRDTILKRMLPMVRID